MDIKEKEKEKEKEVLASVHNEFKKRLQNVTDEKEIDNIKYAFSLEIQALALQSYLHCFTKKKLKIDYKPIVYNPSKLQNSGAIIRQAYLFYKDTTVPLSVCKGHFPFIKNTIDEFQKTHNKINSIEFQISFINDTDVKLDINIVVFDIY
jgi:hypothetical protein